MTAGVTYPAASVILIDPQGRALLLLRDDFPAIPWPNHWDILGGLLEDGETLEESARREAEEECGYRPERLEKFGVFLEPHGYGGATCEKHVYYAPVDPLTVTLRKSDEGQELRFFRPSDLDEQAIVGGGQILRAFFSSPQYTQLVHHATS